MVPNEPSEMGKPSEENKPLDENEPAAGLSRTQRTAAAKFKQKLTSWVHDDLIKTMIKLNHNLFLQVTRLRFKTNKFSMKKHSKLKIII